MSDHPDPSAQVTEYLDGLDLGAHDFQSALADLVFETKRTIAIDAFRAGWEAAQKEQG